MIVNNIFRAIGDFCTNFLFAPYDSFRAIDGWWTSNAMSVFLISMGFIALFYWLGQMVNQHRAGEQ